MSRQSLGAGLCLVALLAWSCSKATDDSEFFRADLAGANEVPPRPTQGSGIAGFQVDGQRVHYTLQVDGLAAITASHIHNAPAGVNGGILVDLAGATQASGGENRILISGSFGPGDLRPNVAFDQLLSLMRSGNAYVNVHTAQFPGGELRGQLALLPKS